MNTFTILINFIFGIGLFINAMLFIPQAIKIIKNKHSGDLSLTTFVGFVLTQISAVLYGAIHKDYILMGGYIVALITCGTVTALIFKYKDTPS